MKAGQHDAQKARLLRVVEQQNRLHRQRPHQRRAHARLVQHRVLQRRYGLQLVRLHQRMQLAAQDRTVEGAEIKAEALEHRLQQQVDFQLLRRQDRARLH
jgi:hypothetical protein